MPNLKKFLRSQTSITKLSIYLDSQDQELIQVILQEMPELIDLKLYCLNTTNYCLDGIPQNHRIKSLKIESPPEEITNLASLLPNLECLILPYSVKCTSELLESINQKLTKLKKLCIGNWSQEMKIMCLPSVVEVSLFVSQFKEVEQMPYIRQFLDLNRQVQILHLSENMIGKIDLSQYENIKIIKYFA